MKKPTFEDKHRQILAVFSHLLGQRLNQLYAYHLSTLGHLQEEKGGETTRNFCIVGTVNRWLLLLLVILILIAISPPQGELTAAFVVCSFGLSEAFSKTKSQKSREAYVVHSLCKYQFYP